MAGRQAKILTDQQIETLLAYAAATRNPDRDRVIALLSMKAGLRAGEIANLTWDMVIGPTGDVGRVLELQDHAAKNKGGRRIPLHPDLRAALVVWQTRTRGAVGPVITSQRGAKMTAVSIVNWFAKAFRVAGFEG
jgi:integrase/recombinase XerD